MNTDNMSAPIEKWENFCDVIRQTGAEILQSADYADPVSQAEGLRYLTRLLRSGMEKFVEYSDPRDPYLANVYNDHLKWGLDNPDSLYALAFVDSDMVYEISGNVGSVNYFNFTSAKMNPAAMYEITSVLNSPDVVVDAEGNFTIMVGGEAQSTNWVALPAGANSILVRQTFADRSQEREMSFRIRIASKAPDRTPMSLDFAIESVARAEAFFRDTGRTFVKLTQKIGQGHNQLPLVDQDLMLSMGGDPNYAYFWGSFEIASGEALLVHWPEVPETDTWNLCLYNWWLESLDFTKAAILVNKHLAKKNEDGSLTIVVAAEQPAHGNWLDTLGHTRGNMMSRWINPDQIVHAQTALVRLDEVDWSSALSRWPEAKKVA